MLLKTPLHIYTMNYDIESVHNFNNMSNRLFCTFTPNEGIDELVNDITGMYNIMYNKMFVLFIKSTNEYCITYNIEAGNVDKIPENTILLHRKKDSNTLYTINALNELVKSLNNGIEDRNYPINWEDYKNSILLTQQGRFIKLNTKIYKIINL